MDEDPRQRLAYDRTLLANERTCAAWLRTGLGIAAFGLALGHLPGRADLPERAAAAALVAIGAMVVLYGGWRFVQVGRELREAGSRAARASAAPIVILSLVLAVIMATLFFSL